MQINIHKYGNRVAQCFQNKMMKLLKIKSKILRKNFQNYSLSSEKLLQVYPSKQIWKLKRFFYHCQRKESNANKPTKKEYKCHPL